MQKRKRWHTPKPKKGQILAKYGKDPDCNEYDLQFCHPANTCNMSRDIRMVMLAFNQKIDGKSMIDELEERGYDLTTLEFSIFKKDIDGSDNPS